MDDLSDALCVHIARFDAARLPASTLEAAKRVLLDAVGVMLGASGMAGEAAPFRALARSGGPGPCAVLGTDERVFAPMAALANGAMAHALDFEDAFDAAPGHPNASLVPALIALAQCQGPVDGRRFLTALALGGDLACRMGLALRRPMEAGGWYPPPMLAGMGAAAGAARLLGLDARGVRDALSLMLCQNVMPGEIKHSAGSVIRAVREGFPAQAAVTSALLAREGVTGFEQPLEGAAGFFALYAGGQFAAHDMTERLGEHFWIEQLTFKPWPSCRGTHPFIEMALDLRTAHALDPAEIVAIEAGIDDVQRMLTEPPGRKAAPATVIDAKFSIPFCTALALVNGRVDLDSFDAATLADPAVLALSARVEARIAADAAWRRGSGGSLVLRLANGRVLAATRVDALGCPERPLDESALVAKFADCAGRAERPLAPAQAMALAERLLTLEDCADVGAVFTRP